MLSGVSVQNVHLRDAVPLASEAGFRVMSMLARAHKRSGMSNAEIRSRGIAMRGCHPRDLIEHALAIAKYLDQPRQLTPALLSEACASYFVEDRDIASA